MLALFFKGRSLPKFPIGIAVKGKALFSMRERSEIFPDREKNEKNQKKYVQTLDTEVDDLVL